MLRGFCVPKTATALQNCNLTHYCHGDIDIHDHGSLETTSCGCYTTEHVGYTRNPGLAGYRAQSGIEFVDAFKQVECKCGAGKVDPKVTLKMQRDAGTPQATGRETPVAVTLSYRLKDAILHQGLDKFGLYATTATKLGQRESRLFVD
jgi:hypothetical protein